MPNAKQCDICGAFYAAHKNSKRLRGCGYLDTAAIIIYDPETEIVDYDDDPNKLSLETCPVCLKRIKGFIGELKGSKQEATDA